jgi:hypothetical protein
VVTAGLGFDLMLQWCYNGVTMVSQWCYSGVTMIFQPYPGDTQHGRELLA